MRILVIETQPHVRTALQYLLSQQDDVDSVIVLDAGVGLAAKIAVVHPDILILDWELPRHASNRLIAVARRLPDPPRIVVLSSSAEAEKAARAAGGDAFVTKSDAPETFLTVLRSIAPHRTDATSETS